MTNKQALTIALIFLAFAVMVFLLSLKKESKEKELTEDVHSSVSFDWPYA